MLGFLNFVNANFLVLNNLLALDDCWSFDFSIIDSFDFINEFYL